jgi:hypothetical protein
MYRFPKGEISFVSFFGNSLDTAYVFIALAVAEAEIIFIALGIELDIAVADGIGMFFL